MMVLKIQVYNEPKAFWEFTEFETWSQLMAEGWVLMEIDKYGVGVFSRKGHINSFRNVEVIGDRHRTQRQTYNLVE
jgi:hypothetical protein